jgi:tetratricopeptide (TPR) repeat protein
MQAYFPLSKVMPVRSLKSSYWALALSAVLASGCAQVVQLPPDVPSCDAPCSTARGWDAYARGNWGQTAYFQQAITIDSLYAEAWMGLGYLHIEQGAIEQASFEFLTAADLDTSLVAAFAGSAFCFAALRDDYSAENMALTAIDKGGPDFVFNHNPSITTASLRYLLATIYFRNQNYELARAELDLLFPNNDLNPDSRTYVAEMLALIDSYGAL